jgi:hypothetical protein
MTDDLARLRREFPAWRIEWDATRGVLTAVKQYGKRRGRHIEARNETDLRREIRATTRETGVPRSRRSGRRANG